MSSTPQELLNKINAYRKAIAETKQSVARDQGQLLSERSALAQLLPILSEGNIEEKAKSQYELNVKEIQKLELEASSLMAKIEEEFPL